jgi:hypothetical protein
MAPSLLLGALMVWVGWRILKENKGNRFVKIGIFAFVFFFSGIWMSFSFSETVTKVWLLTGFSCALIAFIVFFVHIAGPSATDKRATEGASDSETDGKRKWTLVVCLVALEVLLMYLTGHFGQGTQTGMFMVVSLLWFFNTLALVGTVIAQFLPRKTG